MFLLPPCLAFPLLVLLFRRETSTLRGAILQAAVAWGGFVVATSELLSLAHALSFAGVLAAWAAIDAWLVLAVLARRPWAAPSARPRAADPFTAGQVAMLGCIGVVMVVTGFITVVAAPNTWDAMESHLPRAFFWVQNHTVAFFPSPHFLQNIATPFAQFAIAQSFILLGNDGTANSIQFLGMAGSVLAASLIARQLGGGRGAQILAALVCATIPEGVLEASGAQNTYIGAFWIAAAAYFVLNAKDEPGWRNSLALAGAVGLAVLTKGTAYTLLPPVLIGLWLALPGGPRLSLVKAAPVLAVVVVVLNAGYYLRNYGLTGLPLGVPFPEAGQLAGGYANATYTLGGTVANVLRNISLHLAVPGGGTLLAPVFVAALRAIGQDPDDPTHTWPEQGFHWPFASHHEIFAGNPLHLLLAALAIGLIAARPRVPGTRTRAFYALGLIGSLVLFSAMVRYTIWSSRYHIPLFVLAAPLTAVMLRERLGPRWSSLIGFALFAAAVPFLVDNSLRSLLPGAPANILQRPRADIYFADFHLDAAADFQRAVASLDGDPCRDIGILADLSSPEPTLVFSPKAFYVYPVLALLQQRDLNRRFAYVDVRNSSARYRTPETFHPCAIVCLDCTRDPTAGAEFGLTRRQAFGDTVVLTGGGG